MIDDLVRRWFFDYAARQGTLPTFDARTKDLSGKVRIDRKLTREEMNRIIIATALEQDALLVTADGRFVQYPELAGRLLA